MNREELRQRFQGVVGVTATPFDDNYEVDCGRMADLTRWWVEKCRPEVDRVKAHSGVRS